MLRGLDQGIDKRVELLPADDPLVRLREGPLDFFAAIVERKADGEGGDRAGELGRVEKGGNVCHLASHHSHALVINQDKTADRWLFRFDFWGPGGFLEHVRRC